MSGSSGSAFNIGSGDDGGEPASLTGSSGSLGGPPGNGGEGVVDGWHDAGAPADAATEVSQPADAGGPPRDGGVGPDGGSTGFADGGTGSTDAGGGGPDASNGDAEYEGGYDGDAAASCLDAGDADVPD